MQHFRQPAIDLPGGVAVWVLVAHVYALLVPVGFLVVVYAHAGFLQRYADWPLLLLAGCLMVAASACEIAQNSIDRWYITPASASGEGKSLCDLMFFWLVVASQAAIVMACFGHLSAVTVMSALLVLAYPLFYFSAAWAFVPLAVLGIGSSAAVWLVFGDPVAWLALASAGLTQVFYTRLLATGNQVLHGFTTLAASSGALFPAWAMHAAASGSVHDGSLVLLWLLAALVVAGLAFGLSAGLQATPRRSGRLRPHS